MPICKKCLWHVGEIDIHYYNFIDTVSILMISLCNILPTTVWQPFTFQVRKPTAKTPKRLCQSRFEISFLYHGEVSVNLA